MKTGNDLQISLNIISESADLVYKEKPGEKLEIILIQLYNHDKQWMRLHFKHKTSV